MEIQELIVFIMEMIGTVAFSVSGAMVGIERGMDIFGVCVLGVFTAVGGGMARDIILGCIPTALVNPVYVAVAAVTALLVFLALLLKRVHFPEKFLALSHTLMLAMDSVGLGVFTVMGVLTGIRAGYLENRFLLIFLGTLTGVGGGLLRDVLAGVPPYIFVKHIYALASIAGACSFVVLYTLFSEVPALILSSVLVVLIRVLAAHFHWNLPRLKVKQ